MRTGDRLFQRKISLRRRDDAGRRSLWYEAEWHCDNHSVQVPPPSRTQFMETIILRQWRESDLEPLAEMNSDPEVMRYFPALLSREQSEAWLQRQRALIDEQGWGLWALDVNGELAGFVGLAVPRFEASFTPCVEAGWRLRRAFWGRSIACKGARQAIRFGFEVLHLAQIVSFTAAVNLRSRRLMERLGFTHDAANDFDHPAIPVGHELRPHVLYRNDA